MHKHKSRKSYLTLKTVNVERIYSTEERNKDIDKMKKYFETRMNPMQRLAS